MAGHGRAVFPGAQGTNIGAEYFGQHRHDPVGKIDRIAALAGLAVKRAAGADVKADMAMATSARNPPCPSGSAQMASS